MRIRHAWYANYVRVIPVSLLKGHTLMPFFSYKLIHKANICVKQGYEIRYIIRVTFVCCDITITPIYFNRSF